MPITVRIPTPLRKLTNELDTIVADESETLAQLIDVIEGQYPGLKERICDETGELRRFVNVYVNDDDIRYLDRDATPVKEGDTVSIVPSIAGGR